MVTPEPTTRCAYCQHEVAIPEEYREALLNAEREVEADALTQTAFRTLGAPPAWPLRAMAGASTGCFGAATVVLLSIGASLKLVNWALDRGEGWFHVNAWDWFGSQQVDLVRWSFGFSLMGAMFALGAFGRRRAIDLQRLHQALAARPPKRPGGPALCRICGAPLNVPENARGVRCAYCRTDNLVAIPASWLARQRGFASKVTREAKGALRAQLRETRRLYLRLAIQLGIVGAVAAVILSASVHQLRESGERAFDLERSLTRPRLLFDVVPGATLLGTPGPADPSIPIDQCASQYVLHPGQDIHCIEGDCDAGWFVPLRAGETLTLALDAPGTAHFFSHSKDRTWTAAYGRAPLWGNEIAEAPLAPQRAAAFRAPLTNWYRVEVALHGISDEISVCATIAR